MSNHLFNKSNALFFAAFFMMIAAITVTLLTTSKNKDTLLFPDLEKVMPEIVAINIDKGNTPLTLVKNGNSDWFIGEMDTYPADKGKVEKLIKQFASFKSEAVLTSNVATYAKWGLENPSAEASTLNISFVDLTGKMPVSVIIGTKAGKDTWYMRKSGSRQVLLVKGNFDYGEGAAFWAKTSLLKLNPDNIRKIGLLDVQGTEREELVFSRDKPGEDFSFKMNFKPAEPIKTKDAFRIANAFRDINFIVAKQATSFGDRKLKTIFKTEVQMANDDLYVVNFVKVGTDDLWIEIVSSDPAFNERVKGWLYQIPLKKMLDLLPPQELAKE